MIDHNPQLLLTDQRSHEKKIDDAIRLAVKVRIDAFFDEIVLGWVPDGVLPTSRVFHAGGVITGRWSGQCIAGFEAVVPKDSLIARYRKA